MEATGDFAQFTDLSQVPTGVITSESQVKSLNSDPSDEEKRKKDEEAKNVNAPAPVATLTESRRNNDDWSLWCCICYHPTPVVPLHPPHDDSGCGCCDCNCGDCGDCDCGDCDCGGCDCGGCDLSC